MRTTAQGAEFVFIARAVPQPALRQAGGRDHRVLPNWWIVRDPVDYTLRWPNHIVADELQRLIALAESEGVTTEWLEEAGTLLRQAFSTVVPAEDFERVRGAASLDPIYGDEEPF